MEQKIYEYNNKKYRLATSLEEINLKKTKAIEITKAGYTSLFPVIYTLKNLEVLIFNSSLEKVSNEIANLKKLKVLDLSGNKLNTLPKSITQLQQLEVLEIGRNNFNFDLPDLSPLKKIKDLNLTYLELNPLPEFIYKLKSLETLNLCCVHLDEISEKIGQLVNLTDLYLTRNDLSDLPESIKKLKKLSFLDLEGNMIFAQEQKKINELLPNCSIYYEDSSDWM